MSLPSIPREMCSELAAAAAVQLQGYREVHGVELEDDRNESLAAAVASDWALQARGPSVGRRRTDEQADVPSGFEGGTWDCLTRLYLNNGA